jgi:pimeloyl-ACP methyl ester carboxylesterase
MPTASNGGVSLYYETDGDGETVAFVGDAGYGGWQWGWQYGAVTGPFRSLVYDHRGTGRSDAPGGPYSVGLLTQDFECVLADAGVGSAHVVGAGLGGMVALQAALTTSRVESLALFGTAASGAGLDLDPLYADPSDRDALHAATERAVGDRFRERHPDAVDRIVHWRSEEDATPAGWQAQTAAVADFDLRDRLYEITQPALVCHGTEDAVWPVERGEALAEDLPRGEFHALEGGGHLAHAEQSKVVEDLLVPFLGEQADAEWQA